MPERKPPGVRFETWIERQIRRAGERGEFDQLPGAGRPLPDLDRPHDEMWWVKQKLRRGRVLPAAQPGSPGAGGDAPARGRRAGARRLAPPPRPASPRLGDAGALSARLRTAAARCGCRAWAIPSPRGTARGPARRTPTRR
ncbi:MAG: DUF1992 domain-containing protein [Solirubrobacterales bacterium]|nr:DUF1992 domain-containing protein [Solirubrobacterales bacterium]MBV9714249.1 DUF1992 domain-containing protein [Solirubrobacterales bacterium]